MPESAKTPESREQDQEAEMARIDRENALVLISELLKNGGDRMAVMRREHFRGFTKGGWGDVDELSSRLLHRE